MLVGRMILIAGGDAARRRAFAGRIEAEGGRCIRVASGPAGEGETPFSGDPDAFAADMSRLTAPPDALVMLPTATLRGDILDQDESGWETALSSDLRQRFLLTRAATPLFLAAGRGVIVHIVGAGSLVGEKGRAGAGVIELAAVGLMRATALDLVETGVRCNCVALAGEDDGVALAAFLISDAASGFDGQILLANGDRAHLFDQPRPIRIAHAVKGWSASSMGDQLARPWASAFMNPSETLFDVL